jgi:DNA-binding CsgD family transcriptional regulator
MSNTLNSDRLAALSQAVLQLHCGSRDWPAAAFDARAIDTLAAVLPHTACLWGSVQGDEAPATPPSVQGLFCQGLDASTLAACLAGDGPPPGLQAEQLEPLAGRRVALRLWRDSTQLPFDDADRQALAFVLPHLVEAQRENRLGRALDSEGAARARRSLALCDASGRLQQVDAHGLTQLRLEWPRWLGTLLPPPLVAALREGLARAADASATDAALPPFFGRVITVLMVRSGELVLLEIRRRAAADKLSVRQRDIAGLYAAGHSGPQIADRLGLSASTVNNHLGVVFKKLAVHNKLQLADALRTD